MTDRDEPSPVPGCSKATRTPRSGTSSRRPRAALSASAEPLVREQVAAPERDDPALALVVATANAAWASPKQLSAGVGTS